mgnify:CR=1 FL=1
MKRKSFVSILIVLLALFSLTRCKLAEVETIDEIPCPGVAGNRLWAIHRQQFFLECSA